jgi:hypothetical protein
MIPMLVGLDLGQVNDYTALGVLESADGAYDVRHLERFPLGTSYTEVVDRVVRLLSTPPLRGQCELVVDATGVGSPVVDLLRPHFGHSMIPATITGGDNFSWDRSQVKVPKRDLVATMAILLQGRRLRVADALPEAQTLVAELLAFRARISPAGHDSYGTPDWREREHDDLVLAVALAAWVGEHPRPRVEIIV